MDQGIPQSVGEVRASSVGRFVRILRRVVRNRQSGVFVQQRATRRAVNLGEEIRRIEGEKPPSSILPNSPTRNVHWSSDTLFRKSTECMRRPPLTNRPTCQKES